MAVLLCTLMILTDQQIAPIDVAKRRGNDFAVGDTVRVHQKIVEKDKTRIQVFEGTVISRKHGTEPGATFTVRRVGTDGIAVEKIFPLYTPTIDRVEVVQKIKTRRAKLYFLRGRTPKQIREKLRNTITTLKEAVIPEAESDESQEQEEKEVKEQSTTQQDGPKKEEEVQEQPAAQEDGVQKEESDQEVAPEAQVEIPPTQSEVPTLSDTNNTPTSDQPK